MSRKIKFQAFHVLFRLFAFLADKSGGWRVFVRPKLLIGSIIVGLGLNATIDIHAQSRKSEKKISLKSEKKSTSLPDSVMIHSKDTVMTEVNFGNTCYQTVLTDEVYNVAEQMPQFPGGEAAMFQFISKNLIYPPMAQCYNGDLQGHVICRFIVEKDGSLSNISVIRSLDTTCDNEAVKAIKKMPKWIPGKQNGQIVRVYYTIPILFKLE